MAWRICRLGNYAQKMCRPITIQLSFIKQITSPELQACICWQLGKRIQPIIKVYQARLTCSFRIRRKYFNCILIKSIKLALFPPEQKNPLITSVQLSITMWLTWLYSTHGVVNWNTSGLWNITCRIRTCLCYCLASCFLPHKTVALAISIIRNGVMRINEVFKG